MPFDLLNLLTLQIADLLIKKLHRIKLYKTNVNILEIIAYVIKSDTKV